MNLSFSEKYIPIVLCAGFGTRLKPLTEYIPKVVCPLIDKPFAFYNIEKFFKAGFKTVHCNIHYLPDVVKAELISACEFFGYSSNRIRFWHEDDILETGGGITRIFKELCAENPDYLNKDLIVISGDIVADFPLEKMIERWENKVGNELALMCTRNLLQMRKDATFVSEDLTQVLGFGEKFFQLEKNKKLVAKLFTNHQIISGNIVNKCIVEKKSSIDLFYRFIISMDKKIINFNYENYLYWFNIGTAKEYFEAIHYFHEKNISLKDRNNYAFNYSDSLKHKIDSFLKKNVHYLNEINENKIIITLRNVKHINKKYISINEMCGGTCFDEDIIYFCI